MRAIDLEAGQEFIFKVGDEPIRLELRRGLAEVYGTEMLANKTYTFQRNSKASVFTYHGATIEMSGGEPLKSHISRTSSMVHYLNIHRNLEKMRCDAEQLLTVAGNIEPTTTEAPVDLGKTPICLVCEPMDARNVGKSTLCRILLNYAARRNRAPIFVDLDPDGGHIGLPGTIGALSIESPIDIEAGLELRSSMLMHFGHTSPSADAESRSVSVYKSLIENMATIVHSKLEQDKKSYYSGVIINSSSWSDGSDYKLLVDACKAFKANMVIVMDDEVLQDDLQKDLDSFVSVLKVPKTVEIYKMKPSESVELRYSKIKEYFYGTDHESYSPMTSELKFSFLKRLIYRLGSQLMLPDALMPLGTKTQDNQVQVTKFDCTAADLLHHVLAISYCKVDEVTQDPECVLRTNIMGFICITSVRGDGDSVSILTPQKLPNPMDHVLLYSDVQYMDSLV